MSARRVPASLRLLQLVFGDPRPARTPGSQRRYPYASSRTPRIQAVSRFNAGKVNVLPPLEDASVSEHELIASLGNTLSTVVINTSW